jgi:hypothetical protein
MNDYGNMVMQLLAAGGNSPQPVGDVVPFRKVMPDQRGEIAAPYRGGAGRGQETSLNQWLLERGVPADRVAKTLEVQRQHGISDAMIKHERLVYEQQKAREQAARDKAVGIPPELRAEFMAAARSRIPDAD